MARTYATEFPDFPTADLPAIPEGWADHSWRNETAPFFVISPAMGVYVDYADAAAREFPENERFLIVPLVDGRHVDGEGRPYLATDDWSEVLHYVASYRASELPESTYAAMREGRETRADAIALKAENDAAAKPCPDLARHLAAILPATEIAARWATRLGWGFHPDTRGSDYEPALSADDATQYDSDMAELFSVQECDPYAIALAAAEAANGER